MAAHSEGRWRGRSITALACLLAGAGVWLIAPAFGQSDPITLEVWRGNRRVNPADKSGVRLITAQSPVPAQSPPPAQLEPPPKPSPLNGVALPPIQKPEPPPPPAPAQAVAPAAVPALQPVKQAGDEVSFEELQRLVRTTRQLTDECRQVLVTCRATTPVVTPRAEPERPPTPTPTPVVSPKTPADKTPAPQKEPAPSPAQPAPPPQPLARDGLSWAQVAILAGAVLMAPLVVLLAISMFLRRSGMQFRVEVVNSGSAPGASAYPSVVVLGQPGVAYPGMPVATQAAGDVAQVQQFQAEAVPPPAEQPPTAEQFDLGPTYEEERLAKEEALRQQEQAVIQQVFEENCRLYEDLSAIEPQPDSLDAALAELDADVPPDQE